MDSSDSVCLVCHEVVEIYAVGKCDHPICFKCSTRMRALCQQFYCPICRTDLPEVFFLTSKEKFADMPVKRFITNRKLKITLENEAVQERMQQLLEHRCTICKDRPPDKTFRGLKDHMRRVHHLFYCDLCVELKIFSYERKAYNRQDLAHHRRLGDKDDKSYKGHPLCQFCEERYLDKDELYKHLRKDHFYCHFCESLGSLDFYNDYENLRDHFKADHYLCEEGDCMNTQFTNAFRSDIDYQAHRSSHHSKALSRSQARQERTLNIDINYGPRPNNRSNRGGRNDYESRRGGRPQSGRSGGGGSSRHTNPRERDDIERAIQASLSTMKEEEVKKEKSNKTNKPSPPTSVPVSVKKTEDFPSLSASSKASVVVTSDNRSTTSTVYSTKTTLADRCALVENMSVQHGSMNDFPSLRDTRPKSSSSTSSGSEKSQQQKSQQKTQQKSQSFLKAFKPEKTEEDFPELPTSSKPSVQVKNSWMKPVNSTAPVKDKPSSNKNKHHQNSKVSYNEKDFPSLGATSASAMGGTWVNNKNSKNTKKDSHRPKSADNEDYGNVDIRDRFSPVNVPDSDKSDKSKNKKKKKKEKVSDLKEEKRSELRGNSSLDDIANLLLTSSLSEEKVDKVPEVKEEKLSKKKEDKVEKRLESFKSEPKRGESLRAEPKRAESVRVEPKRVENLSYKDIPKSTEKVESKVETKVEKELKVKPVPVNNVELSLVDEFPSFPTQPKKPPPGFMRRGTSSALPPGLTKATSSNNPPPGFSVQSTNMNSCGNHSSIIDNSELTSPQDFNKAFTYTQPEDFISRNKLLIETVQALCLDDAKKFTDFKTVSGEFRRSEIDASSYYRKCESILGKATFDDVLYELLALLPDIGKQQELLAVYLSTLNSEEKSKKGRSKDEKGVWTPASSGFLKCQTCGQVLVRKDYNTHISSHDLDSDFPALFTGPAQTPSAQFGRSWVRGK